MPIAVAFDCNKTCSMVGDGHFGAESMDVVVGDADEVVAAVGVAVVAAFGVAVHCC